LLVLKKDQTGFEIRINRISAPENLGASPVLPVYGLLIVKCVR
jgi:hypothetical protein